MNYFFHLFSFLGGDSSLEIQDLKSQLEECEGRLEKGAEYVDYLQAQQEEMTAEIEMLKKAEEVCTEKVLTFFLTIIDLVFKFFFLLLNFEKKYSFNSSLDYFILFL